MEILPMWYVVLFLALLVDEAARTSCLLIEPMSDISSCCVDDRLYFREVPMLLHEGSEVVDVLKEGDPNVIGRVVGLQF